MKPLKRLVLVPMLVVALLAVGRRRRRRRCRGDEFPARGFGEALILLFVKCGTNWPHLGSPQTLYRYMFKFKYQPATTSIPAVHGPAHLRSVARRNQETVARLHLGNQVLEY
jgi:hypothetical protein